MIDFNEIYGYKWVENVIGYVSDPYRHFPGQHRMDRASMVAMTLSKYKNLGIDIIDTDESIREHFIDDIITGMKPDYRERPNEDFMEIRKNIESIIAIIPKK